MDNFICNLYLTSGAESVIRLLPDSLQRVVQSKITLMRLGHFPDVRALGQGLLELRIHTGPGVRVYYCWYEGSIMILLVGTKHRQDSDVRRAQRLMKHLKEQRHEH